MVADPALEQTIAALDHLAIAGEPDRCKPIRVVDPWIDLRHHIDQIREQLAVLLDRAGFPSNDADGAQPVIVGDRGVETQRPQLCLFRIRNAKLTRSRARGGIDLRVRNASRRNRRDEETDAQATFVSQSRRIHRPTPESRSISSRWKRRSEFVERSLDGDPVVDR